VPKLTYVSCRSCGRSSSEVGALSHTRLCGDCAVKRMDANNLGIHHKTGPAWARWRKQMAASVGAVLLDDARIES